MVLVGHSGAGKTTLVEALLAATGTIGRAGTVADGTTVCDHDPAAVRQQRSVSLSCAPLLHDGIKVNLLDTPGYADFVGELRAGLRAADAALFVVSAVGRHGRGHRRAVGGVRRGRHAPRGRGHPAGPPARRLRRDGGALPARLRRQRAAALPADARRRRGRRPGLLGLITQRVFDYSAGLPADVREPDPEHLPAIDEARNELIEGIIAESEDETLMDRYLDGEEIDAEVLIDDLEKAVARGHFYPVVPVCAATGVGLDALLEVLTAAFPSPLEHELPAVTGVDGSPRPPLTCDPDGPLVAEVVKTTIDRHVGRVSLVRVFSGTLRPDQTVHVSGHGMAERGHPDHDADERVAHLYTPLGATLREVPHCVAGDICAITKSGSAETGDTISAKDDPLLIAPWEMPEPLLPVAIVAKTRADEDALAKNLARLVAGDPTLRLERNPETHQLVLWCMGEAHADVVLDRLRAGGVELDTEPVTGGAARDVRRAREGPRPARQAVRRARPVRGLRHRGRAAAPRRRLRVRRQGGRRRGAAQLHPVGGEGRPRPDGARPGRRLPGGRPAGDPGRRQGAQRRLLRRGVPDRRRAGAAGRRRAGQLALLEPVDEVAIRVPDGSVGAVMSDLSGRRGRVLGTEPDPDTEGRTLVRAEVPATELLRYAVELRSMTSGTGTFRRHFVRYDPMPAHLADQTRKEQLP